MGKDAFPGIVYNSLSPQVTPAIGPRWVNEGPSLAWNL